MTSKITDYEPLPSPASDDVLLVVDVDDHTMAASGTDKKTTVGNLFTSPAFTGTPTAPTATALTGTTQVATTAYADAATAVEKSRAQTAEGTLIPLSQKGAASGVATLDSGSHVPPLQLPGATALAKGAVQLDGNSAHALLGDGTWGSPASSITLATLAAAQPYVVDSPDFHGALHDGSTDDTAAWNAAIANVYALAVTLGTHRAEIWVSDGVYFIGGSLITSFSGRAQIPLPYPATTGMKFTLVIRSVALGAGDALAHWQQTVVQKAGAVILTNLNVAYDSGLGSAACIGGPTAEQIGGGAAFSNMYVYIDGITFATTSPENHVCVVDLQCVAEASIGKVGFTANFTQPGWTLPSQTSIALRMPRVGNNDLLEIDSLTIEGFGIHLIPGEHCNIKRLCTLGGYSALYLQTGEADAINIAYWSCEEMKYGVDASNLGGGAGNQVVLNVGLWDIENGDELTAHVNDPNNSVHGQAMYEYNAVGGSGSGSTITKIGGVHFTANNLYSGGLSNPVAVTQGGTGAVTQQAALDTLSGAVTSGQVLRGNGTHVTLSALQAGDIPLTELLPIAIQASAYAPVNGQFVPVDVSSGSVTVTLPAVPANNTLIGVKLVKASGSNTVTIAGNGATFNDGVATSVSLSLLNQGVVLCYNTTLNVWWALSDDLPLSGLDLRYLLVTGGVLTGPLIPSVQTLTDASSVTVNAALGNDLRLLCTSGVGASRTIANPSSPADGQKIEFAVIQAASGGPYTVTWSSAYDFGAGSAPTLSTGANKLDVIGFKYYASISKWAYLGSALGN